MAERINYGGEENSLNANGNVIETHEHKGDFKAVVRFPAARIWPSSVAGRVIGHFTTNGAL